MLSNVIKNGSSKITEKTLEALGFVNVPKGEWVLKTGTLALSSITSNNTKYIPLEVSYSYSVSGLHDSTSVTGSFVTGEKTYSIYYSDETNNLGGSGIASVGMKCNGKAGLLSVVSCDLTKLFTITKFNKCQNCTVWLEKVGGG